MVAASLPMERSEFFMLAKVWVAKITICSDFNSFHKFKPDDRPTPTAFCFAPAKTKTTANRLGPPVLVVTRYLWPKWKQALVIVSPETVVRWPRTGFRLYWSLSLAPPRHFRTKKNRPRGACVDLWLLKTQPRVLHASMASC
jgi:hypothetical protein